MIAHRKLRYLNVAGCVALTQHGFARLADSLEFLCTVRLGGCSRMATVNDSCLVALAALTNLTHLDMGRQH